MPGTNLSERELGKRKELEVTHMKHVSFSVSWLNFYCRVELG